MFIDMNENSYSDAIHFATQADIMSSYVDNSFRPENKVLVCHFCRNIYSLSNDKTIYQEPKEYCKPKSNYEEQLCEKFNGKWFLIYLIYIQRLSYNKINDNIAEDIFNILIDAESEINICNALTILKLFFSFITYPSKNKIIYEKVIDYISNENYDFNSSLTRKICAELFYEYTVLWFLNVLEAEYKDVIKSFKHWENSIVNPYRLCMYKLECLPKNIVINEAIRYVLDYGNIDDIIQSNLELDVILNTQKILYDCPILKDAKYDTVYQYTSLNSLYKMLLSSNKPNIFNKTPEILLHMSNTIYLNDPQEGRLYKDTIDKSFYEDIGDDKSIFIQNTYIACFSYDKEEKLPMWYQYADNAKGCRIEFEVPNNIKLRKVSYKSKSEVPEIIEYLIDKYKNEQSNVVKKYLKDKLMEVQYYYKDIYYEHEKEIRYTININPQNALEYDFIRDGEYFPRLYFEIPYPFKIKSVMLRAKCPNPEYVALYLKKMKVPKVIKSNIKFK